MSARFKWSNVCCANRAFVHENLAGDLDELLKKGICDGSPLAPTTGQFWKSLKKELSQRKDGWCDCMVIEMPMAEMSPRGQFQSGGGAKVG